MPLRPHDAEAVAELVRRMYVDAETQILTALARAVADGLETDDLNARLDAQRRMVKHLDGILRGLRKGAPAAVSQLIRLAYGQGAAVAAADVRDAGLSAAVSTFGKVQDTAAQVALARAAVEPLDGMTMQVRRWVLDTYAETGLRVASGVLTGTSTRRQASARILQQLAGKGVTGFRDRAGRSWEMGSYGEMVGRTTAAQAAVQGHADRLTALGVDTVLVSNAPEECKQCRRWEGRVLSLTGKTTGRLSDGVTVAGTLAEAKADGLFHPNCRHRTTVYLPGVTRPLRDTADPEGDTLRQQQRARERRIRDLKRREILTEHTDPAAHAAAKAARRKAEDDFSAWREEHDRKNLSYRTNLKTR